MKKQENPAQNPFFVAKIVSQDDGKFTLAFPHALIPFTTSAGPHSIWLDGIDAGPLPPVQLDGRGLAQLDVQLSPSLITTTNAQRWHYGYEVNVLIVDDLEVCPHHHSAPSSSLTSASASTLPPSSHNSHHYYCNGFCGRVDAVATVDDRITTSSARSGIATQSLTLRIPIIHQNYIQEHDIIAVNGIECTLSYANHNTCKITLDTDEQRLCNLVKARPGQLVNLEFDTVVKYMRNLEEILLP